MSSTELIAIHQMLAVNAARPPGSLADARTGCDQMMGAFEPPASTPFDVRELGGVPCSIGTPDVTADSRTLLYFHGGGFSVGSSQGFRGLAAALGTSAAARVVVPDYRLAPEHRFPAAADDALAVYQTLLEQGTPARQIMVAGDSAGAQLAVGLLVDAREAGLALPAAAVLLCPWVDMTLSGGSLSSQAAHDRFLKPEVLAHCVESYLGSHPANDPRASALHADLQGLPPLFIQVGGAEILLDDALRLAQRAAHHGVSVELQVWPEMLHVWHAFAPRLSEGRQALTQATDFLLRHWA